MINRIVPNIFVICTNFMKQDPSWEPNSRSVNTFSVFRGTWLFIIMIESYYIQELITGPYLERDEYIRPHILLPMTSFHLCLGLPNDLLPSVFPATILYATTWNKSK
jgi:hypothetical protein